MNEELSLTVRRIIGVLRQSSHSDRGNWVNERYLILSDDSSSDDARATALSELHECVKGDDGLLAITLKSEPGYGLGAPQAREQLHELANRLYDLTA